MTGGRRTEDEEEDSAARNIFIPQRRTISPYDLTSSDNPGSIITQVQLRGHNYEEWARAIRTALRARKKFGFVDRSIPQPEEDSPDYEDWWTNNSLLVSWIRNTIEPTLRSSISYIEMASALWDDIKSQFSVVNGPKIQQLKRELADCKQRGMTMVAYYGKLKKIWDDLNDLDQFPTCTCGKCTCDLSARIEKKWDEEKVHQLLMGLDEKSYGVVRSNLPTQEPLPSVGRVYAVLTQDESSRDNSRTQEDRGEITSFAAQVVPREKRREMKDRERNTLCTNFRKPGHEIDNCFQLIGYPEWWPERTKLTG
ncbi:unnamed protein product [Cuscuta europaea]|uniref:Retrotransposon Copia-like N-terminal domain-containing protein n=1 Tax=Cuscuta europaea TaxID=41803 RepID=A0A9P0ZLY3_CUSEU|nr:unnamed protein product [Cuscuta europaea]